MNSGDMERWMNHSRCVSGDATINRVDVMCDDECEISVTRLCKESLTCHSSHQGLERESRHIEHINRVKA